MENNFGLTQRSVKNQSAKNRKVKEKEMPDSEIRAFTNPEANHGHSDAVPGYRANIRSIWTFLTVRWFGFCAVLKEVWDTLWWFVKGGVVILGVIVVIVLCNTCYNGLYGAGEHGRETLMQPKLPNPVHVKIGAAADAAGYHQKAAVAQQRTGGAGRAAGQQQRVDPAKALQAEIQARRQWLSYNPQSGDISSFNYLPENNLKIDKEIELGIPIQIELEIDSGKGPVKHAYTIGLAMQEPLKKPWLLRNKDGAWQSCELSRGKKQYDFVPWGRESLKLQGQINTAFTRMQVPDTPFITDDQMSGRRVYGTKVIDNLFLFWIQVLNEDHSQWRIVRSLGKGGKGGKGGK